MRRLATLAVMAVVAAGCTSGGEVGPAGAAGPGATFVTNTPTSCSGAANPASGFYCAGHIVVLNGIHAGQTIQISAWTQMNNSTASAITLGPGLCFHAVGDVATPTSMPNHPANFSYAIPATSGFLHINVAAIHTFAAAGNYEVGACSNGGTGVSIYYGATSVMVFP